MANARHTISKVEPARTVGFDEQFWPVVVAIAILSGLTIGTVLTVLNGPWMWGSLIALPAVVGVMILVLSKVNQRWIRRSLQMAFLLSLAAHLILLVIAYRTEVFAKWFTKTQVVSTTPVEPKVIEISSRQQPPILKPLDAETPDDPNVEKPEKEERETVTPVEKVQPIPVEQKQPTRDPKMVRKETPTEAVPKSGESLSKLSRQTEKRTRQSAEMEVAAASSPSKRETSKDPARESDKAAEVQKTETASAANRREPTESKATAATRKVERRETAQAAQRAEARKSVARRSTIQPSLEPAASAAAKPQPSRSQTQRSSRAVARAEATKRSSENPAMQKREFQERAVEQPRVASARRSRNSRQPSAQTSPTRSSRPRRIEKKIAPRTVDVASRSAQPKAAQKRAESHPSLKVAQLTRQQTRADSTQLMPKAVRDVVRSPSDQAARSRTRRETQAVQAAAEFRSTPNLRPRRANLMAVESSTPNPVEAPSLTPAPSANSESPTASQSVAMTKSNAGTAGAGLSPNLGRDTSSMQSPAMRASNSARRERAVSNSNQQEALSPRQMSKISRAVASVDLPRNSMPAIAKTGTRAGAADPQPSADSASAALNTTQAQAHRGEISADKGTADVDVGATKVVAGRASKNASGGGQPEVNLAQPTRSSAQAGRTGVSEPSIVAAQQSTSPVAPQGDSSAQVRTDNPDMDAHSVVVNRQGGDSPLSVGPSSAAIDGQPSEESVANELGQASSRLVRNENRGDRGEDDDEDEEDERSDRARVARRSTMNGPTVEDTPLARNATEPGSSRQSQEEASLGDVALEATKSSPSVSGDGLASRMPEVSGTENGDTARQSNGRRATGSAQVGETDSRVASRQLARSARGAGREMEMEFSNGSSASAPESRVASQGSGSDGNSGSVDIARRALGGSSIGPSATRMLAAAATSLPMIQNSRASGGAEGDADSKPHDVTSRGRGRSTSELDLPDAVAGVGNARAPRPNAAGASDTASDLDRVATARRSDSGGISLDIAAAEGPGGLGERFESNIGSPSRRSARDSETIVPTEPNRFRRKVYGGEIGLNPDAVVGREAFSKRSRVASRTLPPQNDAAIELGLSFLVRHQLADGRWSLKGFDMDRKRKNISYAKKQLDSDTAAVGLALLAFQGAGYNHKEFKYASEVDRGIRWLVSNQKRNGNLYADSDVESNKICRIYSHAIATLALVEAYGMTQDSELKEPARKALEFLANVQDPRRGGWRYRTEIDDRLSDTSVTGWVVMALQAGRLAGLGEFEGTWEGVDRFLNVARDAENESRFRYDPWAKNTGNRIRVHLRKPTQTMTAIGLLMRMYTGWDKNDPRLLEGVDYLMEKMPSDLTTARRDTYYWYYATQVLRHVGGERWKKWETELHTLLVKTQVKNGPMAGSWSPYEPVADTWGVHGGRLYMTTMNLLSLEVNQRYLPLYKKTLR